MIFYAVFALNLQISWGQPRYLVHWTVSEKAGAVPSPLSSAGDLFASTEGESAFANIDGIGPAKSAAIVNWFADDANASLVKDLMGLVTPRESARPASGGSCENLIFVITGEVHLHANRDELKAKIESLGGKTAGSVSKKTSFLINNDLSSASTKNRKASELGVPVISEEEFLARFANAN